MITRHAVKLRPVGGQRIAEHIFGIVVHNFHVKKRGNLGFSGNAETGIHRDYGAGNVQGGVGNRGFLRQLIDAVLHLGFVLQQPELLHKSAAILDLVGHDDLFPVF